MNDLQKMWNLYKIENPSNNVTLNSVKRMAFMAGAMMMRTHMNSIERLAHEIEAQDRSGLSLVVDNDQEDLFTE